jgi:hypothetical protein
MMPACVIWDSLMESNLCTKGVDGRVKPGHDVWMI